MALQKVSIAIPFEGGIETKLDPKRVPAAKLLRLENAVFRRDASQVSGNGTNALCKRNGYEDLPHDADGPRALGQRDGELLLFSDDRCYSRSVARGAWDDAGPVISATLTDRVVAKTGQEQTDPDSAVVDGVRVVAWVQAGGVWWSAIDDTTGRVLRAATQLVATGQTPRVCRCVDVAHIYYVEPAGLLMCAVVTPANLAATPAAVLVTDTLAPSVLAYDVVPTTTGARASLVAWQNADGCAWWGYIDPTGVLGGPGTGFPSASHDVASTTLGPVAVALDEVAGLAMVVHMLDGNQLAAGVVTLSTLVLATSDVTSPLDSTPLRIAASYLRDEVDGYRPVDVAYELAGATPRDNLVESIRFQYTGASTVDYTALATLRGCGLASSAALDANSAMAWLCHEVDAFSAYLLTRLSDGLVVARYLPGGAAHGLPSGAVLPSLVALDRVASWAATYNETVEVPAARGTAPTFMETGIRIASVDFDDPNSHQSGQLGGCLYLGGACVQQYDGQRWAEAGFHYAPDATTFVNAAGGGLTSSSSYLYAVGYEDINAQGEVDRGPLAFFVAALGGADTRVTLTIPTYRLTQRSSTRIAVWRSPSNDPAALYRVTSLNPATTTGSNRHIPNDKTVDTVAFVDDMTDAVLLTKEPCYVNGDIPSNDPVAGGAVLVVGKGRVFTTDPADPLLVRYSQQLADGFGVEFVPRLSIKVDPFGGPITGLGVLDDKLVVFKRDAVFVVTGGGPLANPDVSPQGVGFSDPQLVTSDAGCARAESIAHCPVGLVFQSAKGIYLLGRDLQLQYIGAPVEAYNAQRIARATLIPDRTHVVFVTDGGATLLWDYFFQQWSTFTNHAGVDAVVVGGVYHYLRTDGRVFRETPGVFRDANAHIRRTVETAWLKFTGSLQGFQRIYYAHFIGRYVSPHTLRVRCQTDYEESWSSRWDIDVADTHAEASYGEGVYGAGPYGGTSVTRYQERIHVGRKCQSIRFQIQDVEGTDDYGGAFELSELLITGGVKGPAPKVGAARSS